MTCVITDVTGKTITREASITPISIHMDPAGRTKPAATAIGSMVKIETAAPSKRAMAVTARPFQEYHTSNLFTGGTQ